MEFLAELIAFARENKKFWILPLLLVLAILVAVALIAESSAITPFIYTLF